MSKKPTELLNELESISQLLDHDDDIPLLQESIDDVKPNVTIDDIRVATNSPSHKKTKTQAATKRAAKTTTKNPFLPEHIRSRKGEQKDLLLEEQVNQPGNPYEKVIDEIVRFYLPRMEADLRKRLAKISESVLKTKK